MLVNLKKLLADAEKRQYAIGAFNTNNLEFTQAIIRAALKKRSPVILQTTESALEYAGPENLAALIHSVIASEGKKVPTVLHLDHGKHLQTVKTVLKLGYNSIMLDGSLYPFSKNVTLTRQAVRLARKYKAATQAEIGILRGAEDWVKSKESFLTKPEEAREFLQKTAVDVLAVSIGTMHGVKKFRLKGGVPKIDLSRLQAIRDKIGPVPIVLHGASGVSTHELKEAIRLGVRVVNIDTELRLAFAKSLRQLLKDDPNAYDPRTILGHTREAIQKTVEEKIDELGSAGKIRN